MDITILTVGKLKEAYWRDAYGEYAKRISRFARLHTIEVPDERAGEDLSAALAAKAKAAEGERLKKQWLARAYTIVLDIQGQMFSSEQFASFLHEKMVGGVSHVQFIIGGSLGLDERLVKAADLKLSFGRLTYPHQLMRVVLAEQIFRGFKIMNGEPYHK